MHYKREDKQKQACNYKFLSILINNRLFTLKRICKRDKCRYLFYLIIYRKQPLQTNFICIPSFSKIRPTDHKINASTGSYMTILENVCISRVSGKEERKSKIIEQQLMSCFYKKEFLRYLILSLNPQEHTKLAIQDTG